VRALPSALRSTRAAATGRTAVVVLLLLLVVASSLSSHLTPPPPLPPPCRVRAAAGHALPHAQRHPGSGARARARPVRGVAPLLQPLPREHGGRADPAGIRAHTHTCHARTHAHSHACSQEMHAGNARMHARSHARARTHTHTYTHTHSHNMQRMLKGNAYMHTHAREICAPAGIAGRATRPCCPPQLSRAAAVHHLPALLQSLNHVRPSLRSTALSGLFCVP